jgi:hypothetical protein
MVFECSPSFREHTPVPTPQTFTQTKTERDRMARNLAEAIDDLYRDGAAPRDHERLIDLVQVQVLRAMWIGRRSGQAAT